MTPFPLEQIKLDIHQPTTPPPEYIGRFAPSPSGPLHFGSMIAAVGSYLQAKANNGVWLVRIEDLDPPREVPGASSDILRTLERFGLCWDGSVVYQSQRHASYQAVLQWLSNNQLSYYCSCTRKQINQNAPYPGIYNRHCANLALTPAQQPNGCALRFKNHQPVRSFYDKLQGQINSEVPQALADDFIIHRKDGLFAYQLAVVVDDIAQQISEVVRGSDLLTTTLHQMTLYQAFGQSAVNYMHLPVAVTQPGKKLSKQNHATAVDTRNPQPTLIKVLEFLGMDQAKTMAQGSVTDILQWAIKQWPKTTKPQQQEIII